jgi:sugar phosphate isomerase/epimerase
VATDVQRKPNEDDKAMRMQSRDKRAHIAAMAAAALLLSGLGCRNEEAAGPKEEPAVTRTQASDDFRISLAQWSLHRTFFGRVIEDSEAFDQTLLESPDSVLQGDVDPIEFPAIAAGYGIHSIELVNTFYFGKSNDEAYWSEFKKRCDESGVTVGLIMCDALGDLGDVDPESRRAAIERHHSWVDVAAFLGAHSIRVNAAGQGTPEEVADNAVDGLTKLGEYGASRNVNIVVEYHGGYSSDGAWLAAVIERVGMDNVGTLPDFGNFCVEEGPEGCVQEYDRYKGVAELMPYAKGVSAKSHDFDENGNEVHTDFLRMMRIVKDSGYRGDVGIEYEGNHLSEDDGIKATRALLERVFSELDRSE